MNRFPSFRSLSLYKGATRQFSSFLSRAASPPLVYIYVHLLLLLLLFVYIINTFTELLFNNSSYTWKVAQHNHADVAVPLSISFTKSFWWYYINFLFSIIIFQKAYCIWTKMSSCMYLFNESSFMSFQERTNWIIAFFLKINKTLEVFRDFNNNTR